MQTSPACLRRWRDAETVRTLSNLRRRPRKSPYGPTITLTFKKNKSLTLQQQKKKKVEQRVREVITLAWFQTKQLWVIHLVSTLFSNWPCLNLFPRSGQGHYAGSCNLRWSQIVPGSPSGFLLIFHFFFFLGKNWRPIRSVKELHVAVCFLF